MKPLKSINNTKTKNPWSIQTFKGLEVKRIQERRQRVAREERRGPRSILHNKLAST